MTRHDGAPLARLPIVHRVTPSTRQAMRTGLDSPSAPTAASGTPGTSPACPEDSQERTWPGREGGWMGAGGCVGGATGGVLPAAGPVGPE